MKLKTGGKNWMRFLEMVEDLTGNSAREPRMDDSV